MSITVYKLLHLIGVFALFVSLGGLTLHAMNGGDRTTNKNRAIVSATHGVALLLVVVSGFGALARLDLSWPIPGWAWAKMGVWLLLGAALVIPLRFPQLTRPLWFTLPVLGALAAWLALAKPF